LEFDSTPLPKDDAEKKILAVLKALDRKERVVHSHGSRRGRNLDEKALTRCESTPEPHDLAVSE
jgi:hypothetical protein